MNLPKTENTLFCTLGPLIEKQARVQSPKSIPTFTLCQESLCNKLRRNSQLEHKLLHGNHWQIRYLIYFWNNLHRARYAFFYTVYKTLCMQIFFHTYKMEIRHGTGRYFFHADLTWWQLGREQADIFLLTREQANIFFMLVKIRHVAGHFSILTLQGGN